MSRVARNTEILAQGIFGKPTPPSPNPIVAMRYDIVNDCICITRKNGDETEEPWSEALDKLASQYVAWFTVANRRLPDPETRYAFWLGADA